MKFYRIGLIAACLLGFGCGKPSAPAYVPPFLSEARLVAVVKGPDPAREWYFYYQFPEPEAAVIKKAGADLSRANGWSSQEAFGYTKYGAEKGDKWYQISVKGGAWQKKTNSEFYEPNDDNSQTGVLVIQGVPSL